MKEIVATFPGGKRVDAIVGEHVIHTDQPVPLGGDDSAIDPFSLFLASIVTCAAYYVLAFCNTRSIPTLGVSVVGFPSYDETKPERVAQLRIVVRLPADFPERYVNAARAAAATCKVKRALASPPEIVIETERCPATIQRAS